jgi:hypothetical protein
MALHLMQRECYKKKERETLNYLLSQIFRKCQLSNDRFALHALLLDNRYNLLGTIMYGRHFSATLDGQTWNK